MENDKSRGRAIYIFHFFSRGNSRAEDVEADTEPQYEYRGHTLPRSIATGEESRTLTTKNLSQPQHKLTNF